MSSVKIKELEKELKKLHYDPPKSELNAEPRRREFLKNFWDYHVMAVAEASRKMAVKYGGDKDIVYIGALMHDIGFVYSKQKHDVVGAVKAYNMLVKKRFSKKIARAVSNIAFCHRCKKEFPTTIEEKIVASADAIAHFSPAYYLGLAVIANEDYKDLTKNNFKKLIQDYNNKIFFESEKKKFKRVVKAFKKVFRKK
jgi:putative nucleotidyltransferase with HDIG domain